MSGGGAHITKLPVELMEKIMMHLANENYHSIQSLTCTCRYLKSIGEAFMEKYPKYLTTHFYDEESEDEYDDHCYDDGGIDDWWNDGSQDWLND